jgi:tRNA (cmo5U34)-methyltransferase
MYFLRIQENLMSIDQAFNESFTYYDEWMMKALPNYGELFTTATNLPTFDEKKAIKVLDLGAGTGLFSMNILQRYPKAKFVLYDVADKLLEIAQQRFVNYEKQFEYLVEDYRNITGKSEYDLVISSLSIHHLKHEEKEALFNKVYELLKPKGVFINVDQIYGETKMVRDYYWNHWLQAVRDAGIDEKRIKSSIDRRKKFDADATMFDQITWLKNSGFSTVDCVYKNHFVGVFWAVK